MDSRTTSERSEAWRTVLLADPCVYCGSKADGLDHIYPRARGGKDGWENRAPACSECDRDKASTPLLLYLAGYRHVIHQPLRRCGYRRRREHAQPRRREIPMLKHSLGDALAIAALWRLDG